MRNGRNSTIHRLNWDFNNFLSIHSPFRLGRRTSLHWGRSWGSHWCWCRWHMRLWFHAQLTPTGSPASLAISRNIDLNHFIFVYLFLNLRLQCCRRCNFRPLNILGIFWSCLDWRCGISSSRPCSITSGNDRGSIKVTICVAICIVQSASNITRRIYLGLVNRARLAHNRGTKELAVNHSIRCVKLLSNTSRVHCTISPGDCWGPWVCTRVYTWHAPWIWCG
mmetsp:Transcript_18549/g.32261  ORF Transcript_18549/g.32261 Transcript_18549/m.32261 type:complete len:222 (+) Transcript_18549:975-1640(+)